MNTKNLAQSRYDFFLIWGHGLKYKDQIIELIANEKNFEILIITKYQIKNIKSFIKKVYERDYVPYFHLIGKTKYLMDTPKEVMFIFLKNKNPQEIWKQGHNTGHIESEIISRHKNIIRDKFNEKKNDRKTENHVIHASDNEMQVHHLLKFLGYDKGIYNFDRHKNKPFEVSHFVELFEDYKMHEVNMDKLICNTIFEDKIKRVIIEETPQYKFLLGQENEYKSYIEKYQGTKLKSYYNLKKYKNISKDFEYLSKGFENNFVIVKKIDNKYLVLDGLHRSSILKFQKKDRIIVMEII